MKRRITVTTGTRAEYGILRPVIEEIKKSKKLELHLIVSGMHLSKKFGKTINEIKRDGFKISSIVEMTPTNDSLFHNAISLGNGIVSFSKIFKKIKPDINLILGDRDEMLASALAACHMNIPNAHIHGGDKSKGTIDEYNRHAITKISNIHFAATKNSKNRIIKMGEDPKNVFLTGSPSLDEVVSQKITDPRVLRRKLNLKSINNYILFVHHPITSDPSQSEKEVINILKAIKKLKKPVIAIAPNSDYGHKKILKVLNEFSKSYPLISIYKSIPRSDYLCLLKNCGTIIGNSSSGIIEGSFFKIPVINVGIRQMNREMSRHVINLENHSIFSIENSIQKAFKKKKSNSKDRLMLYGNGNASKKIVDIIERININNQLIQKQISY